MARYISLLYLIQNKRIKERENKTELYNMMMFIIYSNNNKKNDAHTSFLIYILKALNNNHTKTATNNSPLFPHHTLTHTPQMQNQLALRGFSS